MLGNLKRLIGGISSVIVFTLVLVTSGTMSMTIRERVREIAILKALGFGARRIFCLILAESFGLAMIGGLAGCLGAWVLVHAVDIYKLSAVCSSTSRSRRGSSRRACLSRHCSHR